MYINTFTFSALAAGTSAAALGTAYYTPLINGKPVKLTQRGPEGNFVLTISETAPNNIPLRYTGNSPDQSVQIFSASSKDFLGLSTGTNIVDHMAAAYASPVSAKAGTGDGRWSVNEQGNAGPSGELPEGCGKVEIDLAKVYPS